jgi:hypothetical protein
MDMELENKIKKERLLIVFRNNKEYEFLVDSYILTQRQLLKDEWVDLHVENDKYPTWINTKEIMFFKNLGLWQH